MRPRVLQALISIFALPGFAGFAAAQPLIYVTNQSANTVHVLQSDGVQIATIPVGQAPTGIALDSTGTFGYVANRGDDTVSRIDLTTNTQGTVIPVSGQPTAVALTPDGGTAYVVQSTECALPPAPSPTPTPAVTPTPGPSPTPSPAPSPVCKVAAIDTTTDTLIASIDVGNEPFDVAVSRNGAFAYVTNRADNTLSVIDTLTNLVIGVVPVGETPEGVAVGGGEVYVTNDATNTITVIREIDLQNVGTIDVGGGPLGVAAAPDGAHGLVSNDADATVSVFEAGSQAVVATIPVGTNPAGITFFPDSSQGVVANATGNSITIFSLDGLSFANYPIFGSPAQVAVTPEAHIHLSKGASPLPAPAGGNVTFALVYTNIGTAASGSLFLTDTVPQYLTFVSASGGGTLVGNAIEWNIAALPPGGSGAVTATFAVDSPLPTGTSTTNVADLVDNVSGETVEAVLPVPIDSDPSYDISAFAPNPFVAGGQVTYSLTYSNLGTATSVDTQLVANFDPALTFFSAVPPPDVNDNTWSIGAVPPSGGGTILVTVDIGSPLANGSTLTSEFTVNDFYGNDVTAQALNTVQSAPQLALSMTDSPDPAPADGIVLYEIVYSNPGTDTADGVVLNVAYDPLVTFVNADVPPDDPSGTVWTIGQVPGGGSGRIRVRVQLAPVVANGTVVSSTADVLDDLGNTAGASVDTTVQSSPTLGLVLADSPDPVLSGDLITYTVTYSNTGSADANGVAVSATYSPQISFVSAVPAPDLGTDNVWTIGTLAPGAPGVISIVASAVATNGSVATVSAVVSDALSDSATAQATTVIDQTPWLQAGISATPEPVLPGNLITYTISYGNTGTDVADGVELTQSLPSGVTFISAVPAPELGTTDTWSLGTLGVGATGSVTVTAFVASGLSNGTLLPSGVTLRDSGSQLTTASVTSTVAAAEGIALASAASTDPVPPGGQVTYTITCANPSSDTLIDAILSIVYDANLTYVSATPDTATSSHDWWTLGDILPGQSTTVEVTVAANAAVPSGTLLGSEIALVAGGQSASIAQLTAVEATPGLTLSMSALPTSTGPAGLVEVSIDYSNDGAASIPNVIVSFDPGTQAAMLSAAPGVADLDAPSWDLGTLGPGANGTLVATIITAAPAGRILTVSSSAVGDGQSRSATLNLASNGTSDVRVTRAQYRSSRRNNAKIQMEVDALPPTFNGTEDVIATISSPSQILVAFYFPADTITPKGTGYKATVLPLLGGKIKLGIKQKKDVWRLRVKGKKLPNLPFSDSHDLRLSIGLGSTGFSTVRSFSPVGPETPGVNQYLRYKGQ